MLDHQSEQLLLEMFGPGLLNAYGLSEVGSCATRLPGSKEFVVNNDTHVINIYSDDGKPSDNGMAVVTPLFKTDLPIINYETRHGNFTNTLNRLLELGVVPVINENDTVATEEIVIGDNDTLAANVARSVGAQMLILLSDIDGLYTADPHTDPNARLLPVVRRVDEDIKKLAGVSSTTQGTGGMVTKLRAAEICLDCGCEMVIANGNNPAALYDIVEGKPVGTRFVGERT